LAKPLDLCSKDGFYINYDKILQSTTKLDSLQHPNKINTIISFPYDNYFYIISEIYNGGDFNGFFSGKMFLSENTAKYYASQLIDVLKYCHKNKVHHNNVNMNNILFKDKSLKHIVVIFFNLIYLKL